MHKRKASKGRFELMNARRERGLTALRHKMIEAAMTGGQSGFAVQVRMGGRFSDTAAGIVSLREARPRMR